MLVSCSTFITLMSVGYIRFVYLFIYLLNYLLAQLKVKYGNTNERGGGVISRRRNSTGTGTAQYRNKYHIKKVQVNIFSSSWRVLADLFCLSVLL